MATENQENNSDNTSNNPTDGSPIGIDPPKPKTSRTRQNQIKGINKASAEERKKKNTIVEIVSVPKIDETRAIEANDISRKSNRIATWYNGINVTIALATLIIMASAIYSYYISKSVAQIAQTTLDSSNAFNKRMFKMQKDANTSATITQNKKDMLDSITFKLQDSVLKTQIAALKQSQKQFEVSHSPYITVTGFGRNPADSLEIDIKNQGTQIAFLVEFDYAVKAESGDGIFKKYKTSDDWNKWLAITKNPYNNQSIIAPGNGGLQIFKTLKSVSDADMAFVMQRKKDLFIRVMIYYFNPTTSKYMRYDFVSGWSPVDNLSGSIYFNYTTIKKYPE